ncbi:hypothetical protein [Snodgrassella communis]|uniref:hypothetical protein n=1 Tax=Snodgrassella communis TaxID=2946699 RepID=UPI00056413EF|nr:hypothetical protein [Snodgrassella communis]
MQIHRVKPILFILTGLSILLTGCNISDWYNGYYVERVSIIKEQKRSAAYYDAESPQMKVLRKQNDAYCTELASKPENREPRAGYPNGVFNEGMYNRCMEERGTPPYGIYASMQAEKRRAERRARGEIVPENQ